MRSLNRHSVISTRRSLIIGLVSLTTTVALVLAGVSTQISSRGGITVHAAGRGNPWVNLQDGREPTTIYKVASGLEALGLEQSLKSGQAQPRSLATTDFDFDGYPDLICGYATPGGGLLVLHRGEKEAFAPTNPEVLRAIAQKQFPDPFVKGATVLAVPEPPDFLATGDFDRNGQLDILTAARGGQTLYLVSGNGHGGFYPAQPVPLPGVVTAMVTGEIDWPDGQPDVALGISTPRGHALLIFEGPAGVLTDEPVIVPVPGEVTALALGQLDNSLPLDLALVADGQLFILHGRDEPLRNADFGLRNEQAQNSLGPQSAIRNPQSNSPQLEPVDLPFAVEAIALGEFIRDQEDRIEMAVLAENGAVHLLSRGKLDIRPFTLEEIRAQRRARLLGEPTPYGPKLTKAAWRANRMEKWRVAETLPVAGVVTAAKSAANLVQPVLMKSRISAQMTEDLLVLDPARQQLNILFTEPAPRDANNEMLAFAGPRSVVTLDAESTPVAMVPMRLNVMGEPGVVILREGRVEPTLLFAAPMATFNVTTTDDCNTSGCGSLRRAITDANANPGSDMITFTNLAGSPDLYTLTLTGAEESANASGDLDITDTVTITGNGSSETIIQGGTDAATSTNGNDKVFSVNQLNTTSASATFDGVTVRFGRNNNTCDCALTFRHLGAGIEFFSGTSPTTSSLTVQNCVISDNTVVNTCPPGVAAGVDADDGNFTISNSTISNNTTTNQTGGGASFFGNSRTMNMTNCTVSGNQAKGGVNGEGGGMFIRQNQNGSASISGSTITNNTAESRAGGIKFESQGAMGLGALTTSITNTTISSNTSQGINGGVSEGGGVYYTTNTSFGGGTHTLNFATSGSISSNTATTGSGVYINLGSVSVTSTNMTLGNSLFIAAPSMGQTSALTAPTGTLSISGDFTNNGTFTHNSGTVDFNGTSGQTISGSTTTTFNNLTDSNPIAALTVNPSSNAMTVNGTLTVNASAVLSPAAAIIIGGTGTLTGSGTVQATRTAATADFLTQYTITTKTLTNLTVDYSGAGNQTVNNLTYGHLKISGSGTKTLAGTTVNGNVTLSAATLAASSFTLNVGGNWTNNATFTAGTGTVNFTGSSSNTISGSSSTAFNNVTVNKGTDTTSVIEATGPMSMSGQLTLTNGLLKLTNASATAQFNSGPTIASTAGVWVNGGTLNGGNFSTTNNGLIRVSSGTATFGTGSGNALTNGSTGTLEIQGGTTSVSGRLLNSGGTATISGGTLRITTVGLSNGSNAGFEMSTTSNLTMSSGTVEFQNANAGAGGDLKILSGTGTKSITGGTFQIGNASTPTSQIFKINSPIAIFNLSINGTHSPTGRLDTNALTVSNNMTIASGGTLDAATNNLNMTVGGNWTDNSNSGSGFSPGTSTVTFNKNGTATLSLPNQTGGTENFNNVTISSNTTLDVGDDKLSIAGTLTNNGIMKRLTPAQNITTGGGTVSYVDARGFTTAQITQTGGTNMGNTTVTVTMHQSPGGTSCGTQTLGGQPVLRKYDISPTTTTGVTATVRLFYFDNMGGAGDEANGNTLSNAALYKCQGTQWTRFTGTTGTDVPTGYKFVEITGVTSFSPFAIGGINSPTAVLVTSFTAQSAKSVVRIQWETASELEIVGFNLLRSTGSDGPYAPINSQVIPAKMSGSPSGTNYVYMDPSVMPDTVYYYKLQAVKADGSTETFGPVQVKVRGPVRIIN